MTYVLVLVLAAIVLEIVHLTLSAWPKPAAAGPVADAPVELPVTPPRALQPFIDHLAARDLPIEPYHDSIAFYFGLRGARTPSSEPDSNGTVCVANVLYQEDEQIVTCVVWLPDSVPQENRSRLARAIMQENEQMLGAWDLNPETGALMFRMWTYAVEQEIPQWAAEAALTHIQNFISAEQICAVAYGAPE